MRTLILAALVVAALVACGQADVAQTASKPSTATTVATVSTAADDGHTCRRSGYDPSWVDHDAVM